MTKIGNTNNHNRVVCSLCLKKIDFKFSNSNKFLFWKKVLINIDKISIKEKERIKVLFGNKNVVNVAQKYRYLSNISVKDKLFKFNLITSSVRPLILFVYTKLPI